MLLDTASMYFRAFYGVPDSIRAPDGTPVNAVRGFLDLVARVVRETRPARLVATLDLDWRPAFRVAAVPTYKLHRTQAGGAEVEPPALAPQVAVLLEVLAALGVPAVGADGRSARQSQREGATLPWRAGARLPVGSHRLHGNGCGVRERGNAC